MTGFEMGAVRDVLVTGFNPTSFRDFLWTRLNVRLENVVDTRLGLNAVVLSVLELADQEGWDALLIRRAAEFRPLRPDFQELAANYGKALVAQFKLKAVAGNTRVRDAYWEFGLSADEMPPEERRGELQRIVDPDNPMLNFADWVARAARIEGRVCRVELNGQARGTGFLVGPGAVLTNYHVVESLIDDPALLPKVKVRFDYKQIRLGDAANPGHITLDGTRVAVTRVLDSSPCTPGEAAGNPEPDDPTAEFLDYALLELEGTPGEQPITVPGAAAAGPKRGWVRVPDETDGDPYQPGFPVLIAQHPEGEPLRLAIDWQGMIGVNPTGTRVKYTTNTKRGSSGSPCFDRNWNLIGLHHYGDTRYVAHPRFNQAVPIAAVRQRLADRGQTAVLGGDCD